LSSPEEWERFRAGAQGPDGDLVAAYALEDNEVISAAGRLAGSPGVLIHGRLDLSCPAVTAWELARAWPGVELLIDDRSGHHGSDTKRAWMLSTLAKFARYQDVR
jgi:proline iminopeptidase